MFIPFQEGAGFANNPQQKCTYQHGASTAVLGLPRLDKAVPVGYTSADEPTMVNFARSLIELGIITADDRASSVNLFDVVKAALTRTITAAAGAMATFNLSVSFMTDEAGRYEIESDNEYEFDQSMILVIGSADVVPMIRIEKAIDHFNTIHPDLGQTMYAVLERAGAASLMVHTFANIKNAFECELGLVESEWADEEEDEEENRKAAQDNITALGEQFPYAWVTNAQPLLSPLALSQLAATTKLHPQANQAINAALEISSYYEQGQCNLGYTCWKRPVYGVLIPLLMVNDPTVEINDRIIESANESSDSYTPNLHEERFGLDDCESASRRITEIVEGFRLLGAIDRLITALDLLNSGVSDA